MPSGRPRVAPYKSKAALSSGRNRDNPAQVSPCPQFREPPAHENPPQSLDGQDIHKPPGGNPKASGEIENQGPGIRQAEFDTGPQNG